MIVLAQSLVAQNLLARKRVTSNTKAQSCHLCSFKIGRELEDYFNLRNDRPSLPSAWFSKMTARQSKTKDKV